VTEAREFADAADEALTVLTDPRRYRELLFDLADNGRIDQPELRERITRLRDVCAEALA